MFRLQVRVQKDCLLLSFNWQLIVELPVAESHHMEGFAVKEQFLQESFVELNITFILVM